MGNNYLDTVNGKHGADGAYERRQIQILTRMGIDKRRPWREVLGGLIGTAIDVEIENWDYENAEGAAIEGA